MRNPLTMKMIALAVAAAFADGAGAQALPTGFGVAAGGGTVEQSGNAMTVRQSSPRAVYNWDTFNVGNGASLQFMQPDRSAIAANRVTGAQISTIDGALTANGNVLILNPNGVLFGANASVSVAGLVASTGDLKRDGTGDFTEFMAGGAFGIAGATAGEVSNAGHITITDSGLAAFVAPSASNAGEIVATQGRIVLAGAQAATISTNGGLYEIAVAKGVANATVENTGTLSTRDSANAGTIVLSATDLSNAVSGVINIEGILQADRIEVHGGHVVLKSPLDATTAVSGDSATVDVCHCGRIQDGIDIAASGATVNIAAGTYAEQLHVTKSVTLVGEGAEQTFVTPAALSADANGMRNILTIGGSASTNVDVSGFTFAGPVSGITSGIFVRDGAHASIHDNRVSNIREGVPISGNQTGVGIFVGRASIGTSGTADIQRNVITGYQKGGIVVDGPGSSATITSNTITGEGPTAAIAQNGIQVSRGASATLDGNTVSGNAYTGPRANADDFAAGILFFNSNPYVGQGGLTMGLANTIMSNEVGVWTNDPVVLPTMSISGVTGNTRNAVAFFNGGYAGQGPLLEYAAWGAPDASFADSSAFSGAQTGDIAAAGGGLRVFGWNGFAALQPAIDAVSLGGTVNAGAGTFLQSATLNIGKSVTLIGAGEAQTTIDARGVSGYGILVNADSVALSDFTLYGPTANAAASYGIKVEPAGSAATSRLHDFSISRVTSRGAFKAELDLNGVAGAILDHVTADGMPVGAASGTTAGAGIQVTDSENVTIRNSTTRNNAWGGVALFQSNRFFDQQTTGITVEGNNTFTETIPLYLQDESATKDFGSLAIAGFAYGVRNASTTNDNFQFTWLQRTSQSAFDFAVNVPSSVNSTVQGWDGSALTGAFHVGVGHLLAGGTQAMSIMAAVDAANPGATINIYPGSYAENVVVGGRPNLTFERASLLGLTVNGSGTGIGGTATASGASGFVFNAPVVLTGNTALTTAGANIAFNGDIQNAGSSRYALTLSAGTGNVLLTSGGSAANPLGLLTVSAHDFRLTGTLWVAGYAIDALGAVALSDHTLRQLGGGTANSISARGGVEGSTISEGGVAIQSQGPVDVRVTAPVVAIDAPSVNATVDATVSVQIRSDAPANVAGSAPSLQLDAPGGAVAGTFGEVSNVGSGIVTVNGRPQANASISASAENNRVLPQESALAGGGAQAASGSTGDTEDKRRRTGARIVRSSVPHAPDLLQRGLAVELDLGPSVK